MKQTSVIIVFGLAEVNKHLEFKQARSIYPYQVESEIRDTHVYLSKQCHVRKF